MKALLRSCLLPAVPLLVLFTSSSFSADKHVTLAVTMHSQETVNWCWAASGRMVMAFLGHDVSECTEANTYFNRSDCCNIDLCPPPTETPKYDAYGNCTGCPCGGWPQFDKFGFTFQRTHSTALSWDQLVHQIADLSKPVAFSWAWPKGGGHMMVARGIQTLNGTNYVEINDPWAPCTGDSTTITYDDYVQRSGDHTHWDDFYDVTWYQKPPDNKSCLDNCNKSFNFCMALVNKGSGQKQECIAQNRICQQRCSGKPN